MMQQQVIHDRDEFQKIIEVQKELRDLELRAGIDRNTKVINHDAGQIKCR